MLLLDGNILSLKLRSLIHASNSLPARKWINQDAEQVIILENPGKENKSP